MRFKLFLICLCATAVAPNSISRRLHNLMNSEELLHFFGVSDPSQVVEEEYEIVHIRRHVRPTTSGSNGFSSFDPVVEKRNPADEHAHFAFNAYGKDYDLKLKPNNRLVAPGMVVVTKTEESNVLVRGPANDNCHFTHADGNLIAAISHCTEETIRGIVVDGGKPMEIRPLTPRLKSLLTPAYVQYSHNETVSEGFVVGPHLVRLAESLPDFAAFGDVAPAIPKVMPKLDKQKQVPKLQVVEKRGQKQKEAKLPAKGQPAQKNVPASGKKTSNATFTPRSYGRKTLELALFVDEAAYKIFIPYLHSDVQKAQLALRELMLAFVNSMQALYHLPSLGTPLDLSIVYMEFHAKQPKNLPHFNGERGALLDSFCKYNKALNPAGDTTPGHWDMGLYLSGLDFFAVENGVKSFVTMGLSTVTGVCTEEYNCVIGEFGVLNEQGKPYPSTGFTAVYVMAHEIGHNLGMMHDSSRNSCPKDGFIMSPSRGVVGETKWSSCSASLMSSLKVTCMNDLPTANVPNYNHEKYGDKPGQMWSADDQCRLLLRDRQASVYDASALQDACESLKCKTPNRDGLYLAGPAFDGTVCSKGHWCYAGDCVPIPRNAPIEEKAGKWTPWEKSDCTSGCIEKSQGGITSKRYCESGISTNPQTTSCEGNPTKVELCDDSKVCAKRVTADQYATEQCKIFSSKVKSISADGPGIQAPYLQNRTWQSCAVYCKENKTDFWYTPRLELNDLVEIPVFFPDGTWCHNDGKTDYYCMQKSCVAPGQTSARSFEEVNNFINIVNNARMNGKSDSSEQIKNFFKLDKDKKPVSTADLGRMATEPPQEVENFDEERKVN